MKSTMKVNSGMIDKKIKFEPVIDYPYLKIDTKTEVADGEDFSKLSTDEFNNKCLNYALYRSAYASVLTAMGEIGYISHFSAKDDKYYKKYMEYLVNHMKDMYKKSKICSMISFISYENMMGDQVLTIGGFAIGTANGFDDSYT